MNLISLAVKSAFVLIFYNTKEMWWFFLHLNFKLKFTEKRWKCKNVWLIHFLNQVYNCEDNLVKDVIYNL